MVEQTTDENGKATFEEMEYGDYIATISAEGYVTKTENIAFRSNHKNFTVQLEQATGTVSALVLDAYSHQASSGELVMLRTNSNVVRFPTTEGTVAFCTSSSTPVLLTIVDPTTHDPTQSTDIPYGTYYLCVGGNAQKYKYIEEFSVDGDEEVTIQL